MELKILIKAVRHDVTHPDTKYVRFILGGTDAKRYPGFNGLFTQVTFDAVKGVFIDTADQLKGYMNKLENPTIGQVDLQTYRLVTNEQYREKTNEPLLNVIGKDNERFPLEYSISGWFKWQQAPQDAWQNLFRVSLNEKPADQYLGDRTLSTWIGTAEGGIIHMPTYTYANMNGGGNANVWKNILHKDRHTKWFFVYFGYSKPQAKAYSYIKWQSDDDFLNYDNTNHYYAPNFQVFFGRDKFYTGWHGKVAFAQFNLGKGAFRSGKDFTHPNDAFGIGAGVDKLKKPDTGFKPADSDPAIKENAFNQDKPIHDKNVNSENPFDEYGYGFWMRFLTAYPQRLNNGKNEAWYFVARLANQEKYDNIRMGDRMLALWQGQGYYHFTAANVLTGNSKSYSKYIEGLWTYVYYSYSVEENKAQGFIKFGEENFKQITHQTTQPLTKYLRFIVGGNDEKRYPGFNGLFTSITFSSSIGAYVDSIDALNKYVNANPYPKLDTTPQNYLLIKDPITRKPENDFFLREFGEDNQRFPVEYSISGWYKWIEGTPANQWQNLYRVLLKKEPTDTAVLGDRTLAGWIGFGNIHQSTYTYVNMNGAGNNNIWKQAEHKDRHLRWFFVYHGYSRNDRLSYAIVQYYKGSESLSWDKVNHYFVPRFYVYVGKDAINGYNGQIGAINFNIGAGSFRKGEDFTHEKDFFGFGAPFVQTKVKPFDIKDRATDLLVSAAPSQEKPSFTKVLSDDEVASCEEYGYGFWARYLTQYPTPQKSGMQGEWTFVSRLTKNQKLQDITLGDRTLAIFLNRNSAFHITTYNAGNPNSIVNAAARPDFEGIWIYIHFSHNLEKKSSVAFLKYGDEKPVRYQQAATHVPPSFLQFYLGGKDFYSSWNGQFSDVMVSASKGIFIDDEATLTKHLSGFKMPAQFNYDLRTFEVIPKEQPYDGKQEVKEQMFEEDVALRPEYAWSGWFKWDNLPAGAFFLYARLSLYQGPTDLSYLGDRTLAAWAGPGNMMQFSTYTYTNLVGGGNADSWNRINSGQDLVRWHYVYFGYSLIEKAAYYRVEFKGRMEQFTFKDHKHYYPNKFSLQVARDKFYQPFAGIASYFRLNVGEGAYRTSGYEKAKNDIFAYNLGKQDYVKPSPTLDVNRDQNKGVSDSPWDGKDPVWTKKLIGSDLDDINEYGYSMWLRHLAHYPVQMPRGLADKGWSFVARLTKNQLLQDITVGDRVLAVWLNHGNFYHFTTYHQGNPNLNQNIANPNDIDGVWYYLHFAHSLGSKQSVGFLHNGEKLNKVVFAAEHVAPTFLQFYLGGSQVNYPAFNGQFSNVILSVGDGIFKRDEAEFNEFFKDLKSPDPFNRNLVTKNLIDAPKEFGKDTAKDEKVFTEFALTGEYSWSGWFKWTPTVQQAWHLMVRLSSLQNSEDLSFLGDRVLSAWVGQGYFHFTCYHAANINAGGNANQYQNMNYETDYTKWYYVYYGYSRTQRLAHARVEFKDRVAELQFKNTFQYLPNKFSVYTAKDKFYAAYSGNIAHLRLNGGDGAFDPKTYGDNKQDIFGYNIGKDNVKEKEPEVDPLRQQEVLDSAWNQDKPVYSTEFKKEDLAGIQEYGYGFYYRHLEQYPVQMRDGRLEPWYMMSRLSWNKDEGNIRMGDRLLATWQEQAAILFVTNNLPGDPNMLGRINVAEREGLWTFLYFSYSLEDQLAVGILKFDNNEEVFHIPMKCNHGKVDYLKFTLGSAPPHFYPRFNGQFANYAVKLGPGAFVKNYESKKKYLLNRIPHPAVDDNKFKQFKVVEGQKQFKGDSQDEVIVEVPNDFSKFATEYSISGWLRWDNPALGAPWYNVFRLSLYNGDLNAENRFGDRDLALYKHNTYYQYHTYNYNPGQPWTFEHVIPHADQHTVWHFFYSGYSRDKGIQYHFISFQESDVEKVFDKQKHLVVNKHYLSFGKDYKKFFPSHRGFTGTASMVNLNYGEGAFTMKPFTKKNDLFQFAEGEKKYRQPFSLLEIWSDKNKQIPSISDSNEIVYNVELTDAKDNIRGLDEYGWVAWVRSSRTEPKNLPFRPHTHSIARLSTQRVNKNTQQPGDRVLVAWQYFPTYYFATYTTGNSDVGQQTPFKIVDGYWRFISMSYKKGVVKAYVYFDDKDIAELKFDVKHELVSEYLRTNMWWRN
ncbi:unnamed protein product (macronuclear) [Paramecium tetraurelia]|uniref:Uncharacterized protein n=1 Tax=Paramecium tetraurelia TaxID=5888 RepID=A0BC73_PARTE|nr:uncharacterized protein GSPATT00004234001 [Paramecium tetraurelia]CAK56140.1 unnamed protein product [Paramecium tetraurelia]|eukprot:XP_001423538.1 hypothetical protein (macronuclear) [Paramecium tetraurelia strain d4-2]